MSKAYEISAQEVVDLLQAECHQSKDGVKEHLDRIGCVVERLQARAAQVRKSAGRERIEGHPMPTETDSRLS